MKLTDHEWRLFRLYKFLHGGAKIREASSIIPSGVEFYYYADGLRYDNASTLTFDFLASVARKVEERYGTSAPDWLEMYLETLHAVGGSYAIAFPTVEQQAKALDDVLKIKQADTIRVRRIRK